ncbi:5-oxoprolinase subunit PxpB [Winogradskyella helgolandensis]|uniref:5-oxoprolinase subunit PxpB n=1 Tax=Winogradskyella helgolandensis TaxID=2697010 RepID=UPI0015C82D4E|nr:5-oxoprolinase subunit PxpB [Winogradskyella helgolandensis]
MSYKLRFSQYNERSILIEWPADIDENILQDVLVFKEVIENNSPKQSVQLISSYSSILITYIITIDNINDRILDLKKLYSIQRDVKKTNSKTFRIPVCYDEEFAMDLDGFSKVKNLSKDAIVRLHSETIYTVYFIGFLPGFLYLGGLNVDLHLDRKTTPNLNVKKGSVGIGGKQTGIYPQDSPGGWHIIGNSPIELFNPKQHPPCFINAGDKVKFYPVSKSEFQNIKSAVNNSNFDFKTLVLHD